MPIRRTPAAERQLRASVLIQTFHLRASVLIQTFHLRASVLIQERLGGTPRQHPKNASLEMLRASVLIQELQLRASVLLQEPQLKGLSGSAYR